ncbi:hypothetical protein AA0472_2121 [Acetobacter estunensis NRIC 0472]|nr:hypothetical protein AA0472_2121 [Acetobacter estunensis NRIC 0472]
MQALENVRDVTSHGPFSQRLTILLNIEYYVFRSLPSVIFQALPPGRPRRCSPRLDASHNRENFETICFQRLHLFIENTAVINLIC